MSGVWSCKRRLARTLKSVSWLIVGAAFGWTLSHATGPIFALVVIAAVAFLLQDFGETNQ